MSTKPEIKVEAETSEPVEQQKFRVHSMQLRSRKHDPNYSIKSEFSSKCTSPVIKMYSYCSEARRNHLKTMQIQKKAKKSSAKLWKESFALKMKIYKLLKKQRLNGKL